MSKNIMYARNCYWNLKKYIDVYLKNNWITKV